MVQRWQEDVGCLSLLLSLQMSKIQQGFAYHRITKHVCCVNYQECLHYIFFPTIGEALFFSQEILGVLHIIQSPFPLHYSSPVHPEGDCLVQPGTCTQSYFGCPQCTLQTGSSSQWEHQSDPTPWAAQGRLTLLWLLQVWDPTRQSRAWPPLVIAQAGEKVEQLPAQLRPAVPGSVSCRSSTV